MKIEDLGCFAVLFVLIVSPLMGVPVDTVKETLGDALRNGLSTDKEEGISGVSETRNENGLVAQWHFDEGTGDHVGDRSGNGNHGTLNVGGGDNVNGKWVEGVRGKALEFDGVDDYVVVNDDNTLDLSDEFTIHSWIRSSDTTNSGGKVRRVLTKGGNDGSRNWQIIAGATDSQFSYDSTGSGSQTNLYSGVKLTDGSWHLVSVTRNNADLTTIYIDGISKNSATISTDFTSTYEIYIGRLADSDSGYFNGRIDEVSIYDQALSAKEISAHYKNIMDPHIEQDEFGGSWFDDFEDDSGIEGGLGGRLEADEHTVGLWHLDEGSGTEARDESGNGNHGDMTNFNNNGDSGWCDAKFRKGLKFDGTDDYVELQSGIFPANDFTVEAWVNK